MLNTTDFKKLDDVLSRESLSDFEHYAPIIHKDDKDKRHIHIVRHPDSKLLAVAHLDWVKYHVPTYTIDRRNVRCGQLDDRLGAWLILEYLHKFLPENMPYDILLTDNEERGNSTARYFDPGEKEYNWMFEWDRHGSDVVMYGYETPALKKMLQAYNFEVGWGSFTDIGDLAHLGVVGMNFGTGYHQEHSNNCWASLDELMRQVERFIPFYNDYYDVFLKGDIKAAQSRQKARYGWNNRNNNNSYWNNNFVLSPAFRNELVPPMKYDEYLDWQDECRKENKFIIVADYRKSKEPKKKTKSKRSYDPGYSDRYKETLGITDSEYEEYKSFCISECSEIDFDTWKSNGKGAKLIADRGFHVHADPEHSKDFEGRIDNPTDIDPYDPSDHYFKGNTKGIDWDSLSEDEWKRERAKKKLSEPIDWENLPEDEAEEVIADLIGMPRYRTDAELEKDYALPNNLT